MSLSKENCELSVIDSCSFAHYMLTHIVLQPGTILICCEWMGPPLPRFLPAIRQSWNAFLRKRKILEPPEPLWLVEPQTQLWDMSSPLFRPPACLTTCRSQNHGQGGNDQGGNDQGGNGQGVNGQGVNGQAGNGQGVGVVCWGW